MVSTALNLELKMPFRFPPIMMAMEKLISAYIEQIIRCGRQSLETYLYNSSILTVTFQFLAIITVMVRLRWHYLGHPPVSGLLTKWRIPFILERKAIYQFQEIT